MTKANLKMIYKKLSWTRSFSMLTDVFLTLARNVISFYNSLRNKTTAIYCPKLLGELRGRSFLNETFSMTKALKTTHKKLSWTRLFSMFTDVFLTLARTVISFYNSLRNKTTAIYCPKLLGELRGRSFLKEIFSMTKANLKMIYKKLNGDKLFLLITYVISSLDVTTVSFCAT